MVGYKKEEIMHRDKLIERVLDVFDLETILDYNDIPEQAVLESLIENDYLTIEDLEEELDDLGLLDSEEEVDE